MGEVQSLALPWQDDPDASIKANLAIGNLREALLAWFRTDRGVHAETLMVAVGALAGFAAQNAAFRSIGPPGTPIPKDAIALAEANGQKYYFGDRINRYLLQQSDDYRYPLWAFVAAAALQAGTPESELPDLVDMFRHIATTVGTESFGIPRAPAGIVPHMTPRQALDRLWPHAKAVLGSTEGPGPLRGRSVPEADWPLVVALVARQFVLMAKDTLAPRTSLILIMESAIAMSKVDPKTVPQEPPEGG
jgi:hypothetical protein